MLLVNETKSAAISGIIQFNKKSLRENITFFAQFNHEPKLEARILSKLLVKFSRLCMMYFSHKSTIWNIDIYAVSLVIFYLHSGLVQQYISTQKK